MTDSVHAMWREYLATLGQAPDNSAHALSSWHFCDNKADADMCADLVKRGIKRATAPSLWGFKITDTPLPAPGDLHVVTDWEGEAQCVIRTTRIEIIPFNEVSATHAVEEGEGDRSLAFWRRVHWEYYRREFVGSAFSPKEDMPVVCEYFTVVYP